MPSEKQLSKVLIVDDDPDMAELLSDIMEADGWRTLLARSSDEAIAILKENTVHLALVDHHLPGLSGRALAQKLRTTHNFAIIMVTAAGSALDRVLGLETAADDYIVKPFEPAELAARVKSVMRRYTAPPRAAAPAGRQKGMLRIGSWTIDLASRRATCDGDPEARLTSGEFALLEILAETPGQPLDRVQILKRLGASGETYMDRNIDVQILRLRRKIEPNPELPRHITTRRGKGYVLNLDSDDP